MSKVRFTSIVTEKLILPSGFKEDFIEPRYIWEILKDEIFSRQRMKLTAKNRKEDSVLLFFHSKILGIELQSTQSAKKRHSNCRPNHILLFQLSLKWSNVSSRPASVMVKLILMSFFVVEVCFVVSVYDCG